MLFIETASFNPHYVGIAVVTIILSTLLLSPKHERTPPGPRGWPLIGNIFDLPAKESWKVYLEWSRKYNSDVLSLRVPGAKLFILNSVHSIQGLLTKRSSTYSDRPRSTMLNDLIRTTWAMVFMNYDDRWKEHRKIFRREFETNSLATNRAHELHAARRLLQRLLTSSDHAKELRLAAGDAILSVTYGITPKTPQDPFIRTPEEVMAIVADVGRGGYLVDIFPFLKVIPKWFPGATFQRTADKGRPLARDLVTAPYEYVKAQVENGTAVSSAASRFLSAVKDGEDISDQEIETMRNVLGIAYLGGADTTVAILSTFTLAMALYPEVQKKAQNALDDALQGQRLPDFNDFGGRIPYVDAVVNEVLRWNPATPFAVYHVASEDDVYDGYNIPKGSIMIPNLWALLHEESVYGPDTDKFIPERFLTTKGELNSDILGMDVAFGFGRRACPGRVMGRDTVWIMVASLLVAYEITDPVDGAGNPLTLDTKLEFTNSMVSFAPKFNVTFKLRSSESMINDGVEEN
ncbi:cytochrome P450 [Desarmillaria ectypa]|nr:cytochrome P450 [Desarmillaria ectypa]